MLAAAEPNTLCPERRMFKYGRFVRVPVCCGVPGDRGQSMPR